jgi:hypothetical protein
LGTRIHEACYQVAELHANLPVKYRHVDRRSIRQFCKEHGIRRDQKPGERSARDDDSRKLRTSRED